ncbi:MAG: ABC transporter substrate-binding protein [Clostridia bacterium]|nr:ABC transporter substrate-binding protein [Clostridia bacterium]
MKYFSKKALALFLCVLVVVPLTLCGCKKDTQEIYFLNFKPEQADVYKEIANEYEKQTGVKVKVVTAAANGYEQTLKSEIAKSDAPTIFQINGPIGYNAWKDYCLDITDSKLYEMLTDKSLAIKSEGRVYGIPFVVESYGIIYNDAIMKKYFALPNRATSITDASQINSFDTLKAVVEDMTKHKSELGIDGVFGSTSLAAGEDWRWQTHLANLPFYAEFSKAANGQDPTTTGQNLKEIGFEFNENYRKIFDLYTNNSATQKNLLGSKSVADSMAEFALGKVAMIQNGTWAYSQIADVKGNTVKSEDIKMMPIYMGLDNEQNQGLCIGTENYFAINSKVSEEKQKLSLDFLQWLFSSDIGKDYVTNKLGFTTPFNTFTAEQTPPDPLARQTAEWLSKPNINSIPWVFTVFPSDVFKTDFGNALLLYVQGTSDWETVVKTVKDSWRKER